MDAKTKEQLLGALKSIDVKELYSSDDEKKRKWFRFGAYDALRMACEIVLAFPVREEVKNESKTR